MTLRGSYVYTMKVTLRLLMIAVLALFATGAHFGTAAHASAALDTAGNPVMMQMADCDECTAEMMQAGADQCGSICASPAIGIRSVQGVQPASEPATRLSEQRLALAGQTRRPDPNPPRIS